MHHAANITTTRQSRGHQLPASSACQASPAEKMSAAKSTAFFGHWNGRIARASSSHAVRLLATPAAVTSAVTKLG